MLKLHYIYLLFINLSYLYLIPFQLTFDNSNKTKISSALLREEARLPAIASSYLYSLFPFIISFGQDMVIQTTGKSLTQVGNILLHHGCNNIYVVKNDIHDHQYKQYIFQILPQIAGARINEFFDIVRPIIEFKFEIILSRSNNIFELQTTENIDVLLKVIQ